MAELKFRGPAYYARVWPGQIDRGYEDPRKGGTWSIELPLNEEDRKTLKATGSRMKANDNGRYKFRRPEKASYGDLGAPIVSGNIEQGASIGNESIVEITVEVYNTTFQNKPVTGVRLKEVNVIEFKPYIKVDPAAATDGPPVH